MVCCSSRNRAQLISQSISSGSNSTSSIRVRSSISSRNRTGLKLGCSLASVQVPKQISERRTSLSKPSIQRSMLIRNFQKRVRISGVPQHTSTRPNIHSEPLSQRTRAASSKVESRTISKVAWQCVVQLSQ